MPKVITSQGAQEFVETGKHEVVKPGEKPIDMKPPEPEKKPEKKPEAKAEVPRETKPETDADPEDLKEDEKGLEADDSTLSERTRRRLLSKHRRMREALADAAESERFAESQFNERKLAEKRAEELEAQVKELQAKNVPPPEPEAKEPSETDAKYRNEKGEFLWKEFSKDLAKFEARAAVQAEQKRQAEERATAERQAAESRHKARIDALSKLHPDYERVFESVKGTEADRQPQHVLNFLWESEIGEEIRYYLAKDPVEATRIAKLSPIRALSELGRLEEKLGKPGNIAAEPPAPKAAAAPEPPRGGAPPPITPLSGEGTSGVNTDPSKMNFKELRAFERARSKKKA